ncbi:uncharacterized protein LOC107428090 isoform X2 [Ziziphus jujuba]|uniref:Uncharacterized protein LOC107428090 isoform X2 n=1 Tax=Ziziphus jujuba TaxID=326968 RepID=A0ABM4ACY2_ZIZJJ|nr:uncharacterized protein LOC107428090 isoform X2 [Ziziphus jujuba]
MYITSSIISSFKFLGLPTDLSFTLKASSAPDIGNSSFFSNSSKLFFSFSFQSHNFIFTTPFFSLPLQDLSPPHFFFLLANPPNAPPPLTQSLEEAQEAFSEFLQEFGVSHKDSTSISMNSTGNWTTLSSWKSQGKELDLELLGFKEKARYLAQDKGDNGKAALLESAVGLSLFSAMNVARYLSAESLPGLVDKVKYMKEIFFSGSNGRGLVGKNAHQMMMQLSIPISEDLQQNLSFFEKIEARRGVLNMLVSKDTSFLFLVESFPRLLLLPLESHMKAMEEFLKNIGISKEFMVNIFQLFPPIIFCDIEVIKRRVLACKKVDMKENNVGKMLTKFPWILSTSMQENYKEVLSFFDMEKAYTEIHEAGRFNKHLWDKHTQEAERIWHHIQKRMGWMLVISQHW